MHCQTEPPGARIETDMGRSRQITLRQSARPAELWISEALTATKSSTSAIFAYPKKYRISLILKWSGARGFELSDPLVPNQIQQVIES